MTRLQRLELAFKRRSLNPYEGRKKVSHSLTDEEIKAGAQPETDIERLKRLAYELRKIQDD